MAKIKYRGPADVRILDGKDLKLEGFEKTEFRRHEVTEVSDEAAKQILSKSGRYGRFVKVSDDAEVGTQTLEQAADIEALEADGTSQTDVDSPAGQTAAGTSTTGGSSTGGSTRKRST